MISWVKVNAKVLFAMTASRNLSLIPLLAAAAVAAHGQTPEQLEYFEKNVRPVLVANCQPCHNAKTKSSGLDLSSAAGFAAGGGTGALIARDQPEASHLLKVIGYEDSLKMPPMGKLKPEDIESITNWVKMGAPWPGADMSAAVAAPAPKKEFTEEQKSFWAFQAVKDPAVPRVKDANWVKTPVDAFILAKLEEKGLKPARPATKTALLRRATFDLTGLPPTEQEINEFLADNSPKAFEKVVDRLLESPRYGERWGRHWLDVARYADSTGNDEDHRYPYAWRYRDYVIAAFNKDMPYDQFVREQIAGDLLPGESFNAQGVVATGFLALGAKALAQVDKKKMLYDVWDEQVDVTSRAFLGMTMACARCHDHKFDPILTKDYYSMVGMFASTRSFEKANQGVASLLYRPLIPEPEYKAYQAYQAKVALVNLQAEEIIDAEVQKASEKAAGQVAEYMVAARSVYEGGAKASQVAKDQGLDAAQLDKWVKLLTSTAEKGSTDEPFLEEWRLAAPGKVSDVARAYQNRYQTALAEHFKTLAMTHANTRKKLEGGEPANESTKADRIDPFYNAVFALNGPLTISPRNREKFLTDAEWEQVYTIRGQADALKKAGPPDPDMADAVAEDKSVQQKVLMRGDYNSPGEDAPRAVPAILARVEPAPNAFHGSGRLEVANWIASPKNPMTARVMVNRLWMWHYGEGIVATPDNFGKMGSRPTHPELLDFLASRFVESGWSVKKMQRMMMLSNAYQMSTDADEKTMAADPENALVSRFNRQRLDVEEIRDGMLAIDGTLDPTMGGTLQTGFGTDSENSAGRLSLNPETVKRRTVYLPLRRSNLPTLLNLYDFGDATTVNGKRALTNVAPQALFMMNSDFVMERARNVTKALFENKSLNDRDRMQEMFLKALDRKPEPEEIDAAFTYMNHFKEKFHADDQAAWQSFFHILLTSNEFIYLE
jgi:cytochrome c553